MGFKVPLIGDAGIEHEEKFSHVELFDQGGKGHLEMPVSPKAVTIKPNLIFGNRFVEASALRMNFADGGTRPGTVGIMLT